MKKCTQCGSCCKAIPCGISLALLCDKSPCPALERTEDGYQCGLMNKPSKYIDIGNHDEWKDSFLSDMFAKMLGAGMGCCSSPEMELVGREMRKRFAKMNRIYRATTPQD